MSAGREARKMTSELGGGERTFAALPPAQGRGFARSWWGLAWLKALEDTALDGQQLKKGRQRAREGAVGAVSVRPGRITAVVRDRDGTQVRSDVLVQVLSDDDWDRLLEMAADRAGHIAALLDRDMPPDLAEDAAACGIQLLPEIGDLEPECGCEAWDHCPHSAALCYQMARLLDEDPFVLLLMRGRGEGELLDELQRRSAAHADGGRPADAPSASRGAAGVDAAEAFAARGAVPPLPEPPPAVTEAEAGGPPALDGEPAPAPGVDPGALEFLASVAAVRARRLLARALAEPGDEGATGAPLTVGQDAVRLAAAGPGPRIAARLAAGCGRDAAGLARAIRAWGHGGAAALAVLDEEWTPDPAESARARAELAAAWEGDERPPRLRAAGGDRWTAVGADAQLRRARDGRWWPYRKERGRWEPAGPGDANPAAALAMALSTPLTEE
ncbi:SWF or SNF family helicase [Streptomyces varsoviensis]|uniref:SWF or SNF family helicase n=1 Tax=Streptomyces varsoviensis TaxID=67373 RepID=UPI0033FDFC9F